MNKRKHPMVFTEEDFATDDEGLSPFNLDWQLDNFNTPECKPWIEACWRVDETGDFQPLLELLNKHAPQQAMPFLIDMFARHGLLKRHKKRKSATALYEVTLPEARLIWACDEIRGLAQDGMRVEDAIERVAKRHGLNIETLASAYSGKLGGLRRMHDRIKARNG